MVSDAQVEAALDIVAGHRRACEEVCKNPLCECRNIIREALEAAEKAAWRPISEHKPVDGVPVLISARGAMGTAFVVSAYFDQDEGRWFESNTHASDHADGSVDHPIAFRNFPTPPEASHD